MEEYIDDYLRNHGKDGLNELLELGAITKATERPIYDLWQLAIYVCSITTCENCPIKTTNYECIDIEGAQCYLNLYHWIIKQGQLINSLDDQLINNLDDAVRRVINNGEPSK